MPYQSMPVITYMGRAVYGCVKAGGEKPFFGPSDVCKVGFRGIWRKIDDANNVNSGQAQGLCKKHGSKLAGTDDPDADRIVVFGSFLKFREQIQSLNLFSS
jgi:hypothetical protein